jgi:hypothetical protein
MNEHRRLLVGGVLLLLLGGVLFATLRIVWGERAVYVNVRWRSDVTEGTRRAVADALGLHEVEDRGNRTWGYFLDDPSTENVRRLVRHPAIEDTHHIDRLAFRVLRADTDLGDYLNGPPAWIARLLEFLSRASLLLGAAAAGVAVFRAARDRWGGAPPAAPSA